MLRHPLLLHISVPPFVLPVSSPRRTPMSTRQFRRRKPLTILSRPCVYCLQALPSLAASRRRRESAMPREPRARGLLRVCMSASKVGSAQRTAISTRARGRTCGRLSVPFRLCPQSADCCALLGRPRSSGIAPRPARGGVVPACLLCTSHRCTPGFGQSPDPCAPTLHDCTCELA